MSKFTIYRTMSVGHFRDVKQVKVFKTLEAMERFMNSNSNQSCEWSYMPTAYAPPKKSGNYIFNTNIGGQLHGTSLKGLI